MWELIKKIANLKIKFMKALINKIQCLLSGKKTHLIGLLMIVLGILKEEQTLVLEGLGLISLRAGVAKSVAPAKKKAKK